MEIQTHTDVQPHRYGVDGQPLVVLLHDYMGRLPWIDAYARKLAEEGYRVVVPDLYAGRTTTDHDTASQLLEERLADMEGALRQVQEVVAEGRAMGAGQVALIGFSMGVRIALAYANEHPGIDAVVAYYGEPNDGEMLLRVPVLFQLGSDDVEDDGSSEPHRLAERMAGEGFDDITVEVFDDAEHGFQNEQNTAKYNADAASRAWSRTLEFLGGHLDATE